MPHDYVNSQWKIQDKPFAGDVVNAYNDGPFRRMALNWDPSMRSNPLHPRLISNKGVRPSHTHRTLHFKGDEK
ncbi:MAG: hypothetical protein IPK94_08280 [Saprospiraceae bacterium]|nr:hypothetical protein [Saprospiraceae bacterium]